MKVVQSLLVLFLATSSLAALAQAGGTVVSTSPTGKKYTVELYGQSVGKGNNLADVRVQGRGQYFAKPKSVVVATGELLEITATGLRLRVQVVPKSPKGKAIVEIFSFALSPETKLCRAATAASASAFRTGEVVTVTHAEDTTAAKTVRAGAMLFGGFENFRTELRTSDCAS